MRCPGIADPVIHGQASAVLEPTPHVSGLSGEVVEIFWATRCTPSTPKWSAYQGYQVLLGNTPWRCAHPLALSRRDVFGEYDTLSEHVLLMRMLWTEGFTSHTTCSIPGRNRVDRDFLFDRVVITTARSDARAVFGHAVSLRVRCGCCASRLTSPALERLHIFTAQSHAMRVSTVPSTPKSKLHHPIKICGSRGSSVQCTSHATIFFAKYKHLAMYTYI